MKRKLLFILFSLAPACLIAGTGPKINFPFNGINFIVNNNPNQPVMQSTAPGNINWAAQVNSSQEFYSFANTLELYQYESTDLPVNFEYDLTVKGKLEYQQLGSSAFVSQQVELHINNQLQGSSRRIDFFSYSNAYNSKFTVESVELTGTPPAGTDIYTAVGKIVELNLGITQTHFIQPNLSLSVSISTVPCIDNTSREMVLSWPSIPYAEEYELEILYVDDYSDNNVPLPPSAIKYDFSENSTRILLQQLFYRLPIVYDRGYLLYRIRGIGVGGPDWDKRIPGPWSAGAVSGTVDNFPAKKYIMAGQAHTRDKINWQLTTTYAENGKRKDVVQYSDGLYMTRQTVTGVSDARNIFTENVNDNQMIAVAACAVPGSDKIKEIIAQEDIYDYNARVGVQIMPVPTGTHIIDYIPHLNKNMAGVPYSWNDFDIKNACSLQAGQLSEVVSGAFGAGVYYSPNNPNKLGYNAFIADGGGYPFSRVQYTDDNTGRISRQGGVGPDFQMESGHETKFYYGTPNQVELDRMFGTEVGFAQRYLKKMVVDANGQTAVTYENPEGKTIATALTGNKPANLLALDNEQQSPVEIDVDLMADSSVDDNGHSKTVNKQFMVPATGQYIFNYTVNGQALPYVTCDNTKICLDCIYDLAISLRSNDGCTNTPVYNYTGTFGDLIKNTQVPNIDKTCFNGGDKFEAKPGNFPTGFSTTLGPGGYTIEKKLTVNRNAAEAYVNLVFKDTCRAEFNALLNEELSKVDTTDCNQTCASCKVAAPNDPAQCAALCVQPLNDCDQARKLMLDDLKPGGQYAQFSVDSTGRYYSNDPLSIFNPANHLPQNAGLATAIVNLSSTNSADPLYINNCINNWNLTTAQEDILLQSHPEHCMLDWCTIQNTGKDYDLKLRTTDSYNDAVTLGLINSGSTPADTYVKLLNHDPFFPNAGTNYSSFLAFMNTTCSANGENLLQMAMHAAYCSSTPAMQNLVNNANSNQGGFGATTSTPACMLPQGYLTSHQFGTNAYDWKMLRDLYLSYKEKYLYYSRLSYAVANHCFNGSIGSDTYHLSPLLSGTRYGYSAEGVFPVGTADIPAGVVFPYYQNKVKRFTSRYDAFSHTTSQTPVNLGNINLYDDCPTLQNTTTIQTQLAGIANNFLCDSIRVTNDACQYLCNSSFEQITKDQGTTTAALLNQDNIPCWKTTAANHKIEICHTRDSVLAYAGGYFTELNYAPSDKLYQTFSSTGTKSVVVSFAYRGRTGLSMKVSIGPDGGPYTALGTYTADQTAWRYYTSAPYTVNAGAYRIIFESVTANYAAGNPNHSGNYIDSVTVSCAQAPQPVNSCQLLCNSNFEQISKGLAPAGFVQTNQDNIPCWKTTAKDHKIEIWHNGYGDIPSCSGSYFAEVNGTQNGALYQTFSSADTKNVIVSFGHRGRYSGVDKMKVSIGPEGGPYTDLGTYSDNNVAWRYYSTAPFTINAGNYRVIFESVSSNNGAGPADDGNFLDTVSVTCVTDPRDKDASGRIKANGTVAAVKQAGINSGLKNVSSANDKPSPCTTLSPFANELFSFLNRLKSPKVPKEGVYSYQKVRSALYTRFQRATAIRYAFPEKTCSVNFTGQSSVKSSDEKCTVTFENCNWMDPDVSLVSITPYFDNGAAQTNKFILKYTDSKTKKIYYVNGTSDCLPVNQCADPILCGADSLLNFPKTTTNYNACAAAKYLMARDNAEQRYSHWVDSMRADLLQKYYAKCMQATETLNYSYTDDQFHYTLYYYDQAGNLTRTIPPAGVRLLGTADAADIDNKRIAGTGTHVPPHFFITNYKYNSLNQLTWQSTPDAGNSIFYYDKLGRIAASQNAKQHTAHSYSYTYYDVLGRTAESGELVNYTITQNNVDDYANWRTFLHNAPQRRDITFTRYDEALNSAINSKFGIPGQQNLRGRVASILSFAGNNDQTANHYRHATHYTYDVSGNVPVLIQDYPNTPLGDKVIAYDFDLVSGKVNEVRYEPGMQDEFRHRYYYDDELRLTNVYTSRKGVIWQRDAEYFYYKHGPLARTELGELKVQGLDYIYTLQGWIKGVNGIDQDITQDAGRDGMALNSPKTITETLNGQTVNAMVETNPAYNTTGEGYHSLHNPVAADAFSYVLSYFNGDYKPIGSVYPTAALNIGMPGVKPLYNGNISRMYTYLQSLGGLGMNYWYDQLNRLKSQQAFTLSGNVPSPTSAYEMDLNYDGNGNIINLYRRGRESNPGMDKQVYRYYDATNTEMPYMGTPTANATNRLASVTDQENAGNYPETGNPLNGTVTDVDSQQPNNYSYDPIGNLIRDNAEGIQDIKWNLQNKITEIDKTNSQLNFAYDALGNRVYKKYVDGTGTNETYYVRDASGTIIGTYEYKNGNLNWKEQEIYGASRLGLWRSNQPMTASEPAWTGTVDWQNMRPQPLMGDSLSRGSKQYELTNHLGNVLATISDRKIQAGTPTNGTSGIIADLMSATDYYAGGMLMPGRIFNSDSYRFGYNEGSVKDDEIAAAPGSHFTTEFREGDTRLLTWWGTDPETNSSQSPYAYMDGNPIWFDDPAGDDVGYKRFRDKVNVGIKRIFDKEFRQKFNRRKEDHDNMYTYDKEFGAATLGYASPTWAGVPFASNQFDIKYSSNIDNGVLRVVTQIGESPFQLTFGLLTGIGIGIHNIFSNDKHDIGWGMANRIETPGKINVLSWGFGNYNKYNMIGLRLGTITGKPIPIRPKDGLLGIRAGVGKLKTPNFIDILGQIHDKSDNRYHFHINLARKATRAKQLSHEKVIDTKD